jgi:hypothetical protein
MKINFYQSFLVILLLWLFATSCSAPRSIYISGKVTPKGQLTGGASMISNIATAPLKEIFNNASLVESLVTMDSISYNTDSAIIDNITRSVLAYALDPIGSGYDFYLRFGLVKKVDIGYKYTFSTHAFDARYQFLGSTGTASKPEADSKRMSGSIGLQYSSRSYELPSIFSLNSIQQIVGFKMSRKDFLVPLIFSLPFGEEEKYGSLGFGAIYGHTRLQYNINPSGIYEYSTANVPRLIDPVNEKTSYNSYGGFINVRVGYKSIYVMGSLSIYHQNYGRFPLLGGNYVELKGFTIVPALGVQLNFMEMVKKPDK